MERTTYIVIQILQAFKCGIWETWFLFVILSGGKYVYMLTSPQQTDCLKTDVIPILCPLEQQTMTAHLKYVGSECVTKDEDMDFQNLNYILTEYRYTVTRGRQQNTQYTILNDELNEGNTFT